MANVLTNIGKRIATGRLLGGLAAPTPGSVAPTFIAWGSGTLANDGAGNNGIPANAVDTALATEEAEARTNGTASQQTTTTTNDTFQVQGTIAATANKTINNSGLFDVTKAQAGTPTGNLFAKGDFAGVPLNNGDSIAFTFRWQIQ